MYSKPIQIELIKRPLASSQQITFPHHSEAEKVVPSIKSALWPNKGPHKKIQSLSFLEPEAKPAPVQSYSFCLRFLQNKRMFSIIIFKRKNKTKVLRQGARQVSHPNPFPPQTRQATGHVAQARHRRGARAQWRSPPRPASPRVSLPRPRALRPSSPSREQPRGHRAAAATTGLRCSCSGRAGPPARGGRGCFSVGSRTPVSARVMTTTMRRRTPCAQGVPERTRTPPSSPRRPPVQSAGTCSASSRPWCVLPPRLLFGASCNCFLFLAQEATHAVEIFRLFFECFD
jgi:hypothetical protein